MSHRRITSGGDEHGAADSRLDDTLVGLSTRTVLEEDSQEFIPGSKVGRYVVLEQIGRGGMGVVLGAFDPQLNRKIALKLLHTRRHREGSASSGAGRQRLLREAQAIAKLSHPHVISVYDVGTMGDSIYVAMEFVEGCTLTIWLEQQKRSTREIVEVFLQAGRGLAAAHAAGLVHRDFKPDNVLVGLDGLVRVSDFGLARADPSQVGEEEGIDEELESDIDATESPAIPHPIDFDDSDVLSSPLTQAGVVVGTPRYMAPEQHAGAHADARSDQFAFCVALYQALYQQDPFVAHTLERLAMAKQEGLVCEVPAQSRVPAYIEDIVMRGLAPEPNDRFPSMERLVAELERDPAAWRHRLLLMAIGVVVAGSVAVGVGMQPDEVESACRPHGRDDWAGIWDNAQKASLRSAIASADPRTVDFSWEALQGELDAFTGQWTQMRTAACETLRGRREASVVELQLRCLDRQQHAVIRLLSVIAEVDAVTAPKITRVLNALPELEYCDSREYLLSLPMIPLEERTMQQVEQLQDGLDRVGPLAALGLHREALELARRTAEAADTVDYPPLRAEAHHVYGRSLALAGEVWDAESALSQAVWLSVRSQHDAYAAASARALVHVSGVYLGRHREGVLWEEFARSSLGRLGLEGLEVAALDDLAGRLALRMGDVARARTYVERAIAVRETVRGALDRDLARWWVDLGDIAFEAGEFERAREHYGRASTLADETLDPEHPTRGYAQWGLGRLLLDSESFDAAEEMLAGAGELLERNLSAGHPELVRCSLDRALASSRSGDLRAARARLEEISSSDQGVLARPHTLAVEADIALADLDLGEQQWESAGTRLARARASIRTLTSVHPRVLAALHRSEGELRLALGEYETAVASFSEALAVLTDEPVDDPKRLALARFDLARARWLLDRTSLAHEEARQARAVLGDLGDRAPESLRSIDQWLADLDAPESKL